MDEGSPLSHYTDGELKPREGQVGVLTGTVRSWGGECDPLAFQQVLRV